MGGGAEMCPHIYKVYSCERSEPAVQRPRPARRAVQGGLPYIRIS